MSDQQSKQDPQHPRQQESVNIERSNATDVQGNHTVTNSARATLDEGILNVRYTELNGVGHATITLDRDKDGRTDATFESGPTGASYFTSGDKPLLNFSAADASRLTGQVRDLLLNGGANLGLYHQVVDFANDPANHGLPSVPVGANRGRQ